MGTRTGTYYTGNLDGTAGSLITALDAILVTGEGWTKTFSGTNKAVYTQGGGNGFCIRVVDDGSLAAGAREAIVRAGESATDVDTLVDPVPLVATLADANCVWRKSNTADGTTRPYYAVADDRTLVMFVEYGGTGGNADLYIFGDTEPFWPGDNYATMLSVRGTGNTTGIALALGTPTVFRISGTSSPGTSPRFFVRNADGSTKVSRAAMAGLCNTFGNADSGSVLDYPNGLNLKLAYAPAFVLDPNILTNVYSDNAMFRSVIPFLFEPLIGTGVTSLAHLDTFTDTAYDPASQFLFACVGTTSVTTTSFARIMLQTAGTWDVGV